MVLPVHAEDEPGTERNCRRPSGDVRVGRIDIDSPAFMAHRPACHRRMP